MLYNLNFDILTVIHFPYYPITEGHEHRRITFAIWACNVTSVHYENAVKRGSGWTISCQFPSFPSSHGANVPFDMNNLNLAFCSKSSGFVFFLLLELSVARGIHTSSHHFKQGEKQDWIMWGFFFYQRKDDWTELNLPFLLKSCYTFVLPHLPTLRSSNFNGFHLYNCYVNSITERWHCDDWSYGTLYHRSLWNVLVARRTTCANIPRTNACDWVDIYEAGAGSL